MSRCLLTQGKSAQALSSRVQTTRNGRSTTPSKSKKGFIKESIHATIMKDVRKASREAKQCL